MQTLSTMTDFNLHYLILDLSKTVRAMEELNKFQRVEKLGRYVDELHDAVGERRRRQMKVG